MKLQNLIHISLGIACIGFLPPDAFGVVPAPDGGYPGGNTAEGQSALLSLTTGSYNTALGFLSLRSNTATSYNTAIGAGTLLANTADGNTATGFAALFNNTTGPSNTATGAFALVSNTTNGGSTATGYRALFKNTGFGNTADGYQALANNTTGGFNTALGALAGSNVITATNVICIGPGVSGTDTSNSCYIGNIFGAISNGVTSAVVINSDGKLGTINSSRRFKEKIKPMGQASEALLALKPVTFHYKKEIDPERVPQWGLVAEDVEEVNRDLVVRDKEGKVNTVRYEAINAMLLNEFLKEHRKVDAQDRRLQEQETMITRLNSTVEKQEAAAAQQQKEIQAVTASLKEQAAQIQRVSAQIEASSRVARMVLNSP